MANQEDADVAEESGYHSPPERLSISGSELRSRNFDALFFISAGVIMALFTLIVFVLKP